MFVKEGIWIDPQGASHTDAVFKIAQSNMSISKQSLLNSANGYANSTVTDTESASLNYQMLYWTNAQALADNKAPYPLLNVAQLNDPAMMGQEEKIWFRVDNLGAEYNGLTAEQAAEKHCQEVILVA